MKRNFAEWLLTFTDSIADYKYYTDFEKIYKNVDKIKIELNILNMDNIYNIADMKNGIMKELFK